jgi:DNA-binding transcriptional MerR regulator
VYVISVAAEIAGVHPQTLRIYERKGLLDPARTVGGNRRYSELDIDRLRRIAELTADGEPVLRAGIRAVCALRLREQRGTRPDALTALISACSVGPDYVKPTAVVPEAFKESGPWKVAQSRDSESRGAWWQVFNDPRLNELEVQVAVSNQTLIDLRISKIFHIGDGDRRIEVLADILNLGQEKAEESILTLNRYSENFLGPNTYIDPLRAMIGVKLHF